MLPALIILLKSVVLIVVLLIFVAYILYADRKIWAAVQLRRGPNVVGPWGLLQAFADLLKFVFKEPVIPSGANKGVFLLAPLVSAVLALSAWAVIPVSEGWAIANINVGILYVFAISSLEVYGVIMGGWASNSKYPFLGALRSAAQMVSYEVSIGFVIITVLLAVGSLNLTDIVMSQEDGIGTRLGLPNSFLDWHWLALFPMFIVFFISALAETNRPPFDLVEAELELVAGHMIEYSSTPFLLFFLGEYVAIVLMCALTTILFLGGWLPPFDFAPFTWVPGVIWFVLKVCLVFFMFAMVKAFVPRYPLRPADAAWLEGVPAAVAGDGCHHRSLPQVHGIGVMSASMIGALVGLVIAAADFALLRLLASRVDLPETKRVLNITGLSQFVLLPLVGYFVGPLFLETRKCPRLPTPPSRCFYKDFVGAFFLSMRQFFAPKATLNYPHEKGPISPAFPWRTCAAPLSERRGTLHRLQALRSDLPGAGDHHRGRPAPERRHAPHGPLRHRHGEMHLLRLLPGSLPGGRHRRRAEFRIRHGDARGTLLR